MNLEQVFCIYKIPLQAGETTPVTSQPAPIVEYAFKWTKSIIKYCLLKGTQDIPDQHEIAVGVNLCLESFHDEIPVRFIKVLSTESPDITYEWVDAASDPIFTTDPTHIMAYSGFPDVNQDPIHIRLNDNLNWSFSGTNFQFNPMNTMMHETMHAMGFVHAPDCPDCIVYNFYNGKIDFAPLDIQRMTTKYGTNTWTNAQYMRIKLAVFNWKRRLK